MSFVMLPQQETALGSLGQSLGTGVAQGLQQQLSQFHQEKKLKETEDTFKQQGYPEDLAKLAAAATTGGQTEVLKQLLEMRQRGPMLEEQIKETPHGIDFEAEEDVGLTPKEKIKREEGRFSKQSEKYGELSDRASKYQQEQMRLQRLQELNENNVLPKGLGRLNVNLKSGELILPFASSPDSQEFVKIVNDFLAGAKDTFGARVTNFEVNRFLRRLPSLLNTEEGRRRVLRQMEIINQLNSLHNQGILDEFDSAGGVRKVDFDVASRRSRKKIEDQVKELQKEYVTGKSAQQKEQKLTSEIAQEILKEAKGDRELARKIAKKRGYEF